MAFSFIPSSSSDTCQSKHDVFLSFRGEDTRKKFTSHLHKALLDKKIETFIDYKLNRGDEISPSLLKAIEESQISLIIFSKDYASSRWCLEELVKILECRQNHRQIVIPVFYEIDPSHVRNQIGSFAVAFAKHEQRAKIVSLDRVQRWKDALEEAANLSGFDSSVYQNECELIEAIVQDVSKRLNDHLPTTDTSSHLVGIDSKIGDIESLLSKENVRSVGLCGVGGIGKTTLARAVFNKISSQFEGSQFIENVNEELDRRGLNGLRQELLYALLGDENINRGTSIVGRTFTRNRLARKKCLIVFDDVFNFRQIESLLEDFDCFNLQSRIIITTRDKQVLRSFRVNHEYEVKELIHCEALELFCRHAFEKKQYPTEDYMELSKRVAEYAGGIPLALKVLGSYLFGKGKEVWVSAIDKLERIPHVDIHKVLKISYDGLDDDEKDIFLDMHIKPYAMKNMHNLRFLNFYNSSSSETNKVNISQGLESDFAELRYFGWHGCPIKSLPSFRLGNLVKLDMSYSKVEQLWNGVQHLDKLKEVNLSYSSLRSCPDFTGFPNLEKLILKYCKDVHEISSSITHLTKLDILDLSGCSKIELLPEMPCNIRKLELTFTAIEELPLSIEYLSKLVLLTLGNCKRFKSLPSSICDWKSLECLEMWGCSKLEELPSDIGNLESLERLNVSQTAIRELPSSIVDLKNLKVLCFHRIEVQDTVHWSLPSIVGWHKMTHLYLIDNGIIELPDNLGCLSSVRDLYLDGNSFESIPASIVNLLELRYLSISNCKKLKCLPELQLRSINAYNCTSLEVLPCHSIFSSLIHDYRVMYPIGAEFGNCFKLDRKKLEDIMKDALLKIQEELEDEVYFWPHGSMTQTETSTSTEDEDLQIIEAFELCYPGSEIPNWFNFQNTGAFINVELQPDCFNQNFMGFALCIVAAPGPKHQDDSKVMCIVWDCRLKSKDEHLHVRSGSFRARKSDGEYIGSNHVLTGSCFPIFPCELLCYENEVSFQFYIYGRQSNDVTPTNGNHRLVFPPRKSKCFRYYKVEKCGVHLMFGQHLEEDDRSSSSQYW